MGHVFHVKPNSNASVTQDIQVKLSCIFCSQPFGTLTKTSGICLRKVLWIAANKPFHDGGPYHIETSHLVCSANQWTGFYMVQTSVMKELKRIYSNLFLFQASARLRFSASQFFFSSCWEYPNKHLPVQSQS